MIEQCKSPIGRGVSAGEVQHTILREINLGAHHLLLNSDQSIELMRAAQGTSEPEYVLCLDAIETYRLLMALHEAFWQTAVS